MIYFNAVYEVIKILLCALAWYNYYTRWRIVLYNTHTHTHIYVNKRVVATDVFALVVDRQNLFWAFDKSLLSARPLSNREYAACLYVTAPPSSADFTLPRTVQRALCVHDYDIIAGTRISLPRWREGTAGGQNSIILRTNLYITVRGPAERVGTKKQTQVNIWWNNGALHLYLNDIMTRIRHNNIPCTGTNKFDYE